jgi:hypothetical protein
VNPKEQEIAIGELEERVDRLRNLYEQYFLGFEKLEPTVSRKDVDRRFMLLRKEQIRNTAMRFRFNVVTQKFNTYAMHWVRICRQIEEGTYKRHIRKAKARFGDVKAAPERDVSFDIDVDMDEFEATDDVDALLAEADASVATYGNAASDTVPPGAPSTPPAAAPAARRAPQMILGTPGTSFTVGGRREAIDEPEPNTPPPMQHAQRGAALPPGAKPRVVLRRREEPEPPAPAPAQPASVRSMPIAPIVASAPPPVGSSARMAAARPALDIPGGRPSGPRIQRSGPAAESSTGGPAAAPSAGAPSAGRIPVAAPSPAASSAGRIPVAAPSAGAPSAGRLPLPPPSAGRLPVSAPLPAPSAGRLPVAAPPGGRPGMPIPPISAPRLPIAAPKPAGAGAPPPRAPMPSAPEDAPSSGEARPRPRAPLPLPSQAGPTKKE